MLLYSVNVNNVVRNVPENIEQLLCFRAKCRPDLNLDISRQDPVVYLLAKLKPFEQKEHFSLKEQNGLVWILAYVRNGTSLPGGSNP